MTEAVKSIKTTAIVDVTTGETLIAHPAKDDVYVTSDHFLRIAAGEVDDTNCTYTSRQVCVRWAQSPSYTSGQYCAEYMDVRTCNCT